MENQLKPALLALEDGTVFQGLSLGCDGVTTGEIVFNTAQSGYQEIISDPSYARQIITLTAAHIGNVGCNQADQESCRVHAAGLVIRHASCVPSNYRQQQSLADYCQHHGLIAITDVDTRALTHHLRQHGAQAACIATNGISEAEAIQLAKAEPSLHGVNLASAVTTESQYAWQQSSWHWPEGYSTRQEAQAQCHVVVIDFGVKHTMLRLLVDRGCRVTVVPAETSAEAVFALSPDGILLSNGPGDPAACEVAIRQSQSLINSGKPVLGICLGFQILALASGARTFKMKFGHHGANHPVQDIRTGRVAICSQNHGFAVDEASLPSSLVLTHRSLFDSTVQGFAHTSLPVFGFQGHPEGSPGPHDLFSVFDSFVTLMTTASEATLQEEAHAEAY